MSKSSVPSIANTASLRSSLQHSFLNRTLPFNPDPKQISIQAPMRKLLESSNLPNSSSPDNRLEHQSPNQGLWRMRRIKSPQQQVRQLSRKNRLRSEGSVRSEEMCFRYRLKMSSILQIMKASDKVISVLKQCSNQEFLLTFVTELNRYIKASQKCKNAYEEKVRELKNVHCQHELKIQQLNYKINNIQSHLKNAQQKYEKQRQISLQREQNIYKLHKTIRNIQNKQIITSFAPLEGKIKKKTTATQTNSSEGQNLMVGKIIEEWKQKLYQTVHYYEEVISELRIKN